MSPPLVILDIGSTLVSGPDRGPASRIAELAGLDVPAKRVLHRSLMTTDYPEPAAIVAFIGERFGLRGPSVDSAVETIWTAQEQEARAIPGVGATLEKFVAADYRLALLSNIWSPFLRSFQTVFGDFFDQHVPAERQLFSCREGLMKPAPELFQRVLSTASATPGETLMIGDSYDKDIEPAAACGMHTLWINPGPATPADLTVIPTLTLGSLADLDFDRSLPGVLAGTAAG